MAALNLLTDLPDATILAYYRASDVTLNGSDVSQLDDLSGGGKHFTQGTAANQPVYNSSNSNFNNKPTIDPVAASNEFLQASGLGVGPTFTVVFIGASGGASQTILSENSNSYKLAFDASSQPQIVNSATLTSSNAADTNPAIFEFRLKTTDSLIRDKAVEGASGSIGTANWSDCKLFRNDEGGDDFDGSLADLLIVSGSLTQADRRVIYQYANQRYGMAIPFPQPKTGATSTFGNSTTHNVNMDSDIEAGDLLEVRLCLDCGGTYNVATPTGWSLKSSRANTAHQSGVYIKIADGTEGGGTVNFSTSAAEDGVAVCNRIRDWYGALGGYEISSVVDAFSSTPDPPSHTVTWGALNTLWRAGAIGPYTSFDTAPSGYSSLTQAGDGSEAAANAYKESAASSENPGTFTITGSGRWYCDTAGIRPIATVELGAGAGIMAAGL